MLVFFTFSQRWLVSGACPCTPFSFSLHSSSFACAELCFFPFAASGTHIASSAGCPSTLVTHSSSLCGAHRALDLGRGVWWSCCFHDLLLHGSTKLLLVAHKRDLGFFLKNDETPVWSSHTPRGWSLNYSSFSGKKETGTPMPRAAWLLGFKASNSVFVRNCLFLWSVRGN